jgi:homoserine O-acetyltransferase
MSIKIYNHTLPFILENGTPMPQLQIAYHTFGKLNQQRNNVIWVCHALTANSDVLDWWAGLFGKDDYFNTKDHFIVCANILGSPYGTTSPHSLNPNTGQSYYLNFPAVTIKDMAAAHQLLAEHLGISQINTLIGGSLGGQQAMEWAIQQPQLIKHMILIATNARHSAWGIAFNESQRLAISADATFLQNKPDGGSNGLKAARSMALLSYRGYETYRATQQENDNSRLDNYKASSYQGYQGDKLVKRFNAYSYWYLTKAMDSHNVGRGRQSVEAALALIKAKTLVIGIKSDLLFPLCEQQYLANHIPNAVFAEYDSVYGHDSFLIETQTLINIIDSFLSSNGIANTADMQTA